MNVCVFLSAADLDERYTRPAREFAELIGKGGHTLVWGGSDSGLMKVVADGVRDSGGRLVGISVEFLRHLARTDADEMVFAKDLAERKALLLNTAGFYEGLALQLARMEQDGFLPLPMADLVYTADDGADALAHLEELYQAR